jgi:hypothetical protein
MADNERLVIQTSDIGWEQQAPAQASRTNFTPGKATGLPLDMNWPKDYRIPTGTPAFGGEVAGPVEMERTRIVKLHRGTVSDQTIPAPTILDTRVEAMADAYINGTSTVQETQGFTNEPEVEKLAGNDRIAGA